MEVTADTVEDLDLARYHDPLQVDASGQVTGEVTEEIENMGRYAPEVQEHLCIESRYQCKKLVVAAEVHTEI